jgi:hypothetical protein
MSKRVKIRVTVRKNHILRAKGRAKIAGPWTWPFKGRKRPKWAFSWPLALALSPLVHISHVLLVMWYRKRRYCTSCRCQAHRTAHGLGVYHQVHDHLDSRVEEQRMEVVERRAGRQPSGARGTGRHISQDQRSLRKCIPPLAVFLLLVFFS